MTPNERRANEAFSKWLEIEHPFHSVHDHYSKADYEKWQDGLRVAFIAGWKAMNATVYRHP